MREEGDTQGGARLGCAPWQLGEMATLLLCFDIFRGRYENSTEYAEQKLTVLQEHVDRAADCLAVVNDIKDNVIVWTESQRGKSSPFPKLDPLFFEPLGVPWDKDEFASFTQPAPSAPAAQRVAPLADDSDEDMEIASDGAGEEDEPDANAVGGVARDPDTIGEAAQAESLLAICLEKKDVRDRTYGYGLHGASVLSEDAAHGKYTDRDIARKTVLQGLPKVAVKVACDNMRAKKADGKRKALSNTAWHTVMEAAVKDCPVLRLEGRGKNQTLVMKEIPQDARERVHYHNALMTVCGVSLRELLTAMTNAKQRRVVARPRPAAGGSAARASDVQRRSRSPRRAQPSHDQA